LGFAKLLKFQKSQGGNPMLNFCLLSGRLVQNPYFSHMSEERVIVTLNLDLALWEDPCGRIKVHCFDRLAFFAAYHLKSGDRVVVMGFLHMDSVETIKGEQRDAAELIAMQLEMIREGEWK
jgi:single-strand DNA-binding protein